MISTIKEIDVTFDFTTDTPNYWLKYEVDPDNASPTLQRYQKLLWSKKLPNNDILKLEEGYGANYLHWKDFRFGSDSIINMYIHHKNDYIQNLLKEVKKEVIDYDSFVEEYLRKGYTIGGEIIFPKKGGFSINSKRGIKYYNYLYLVLFCVIHLQSFRRFALILTLGFQNKVHQTSFGYCCHNQKLYYHHKDQICNSSILIFFRCLF